MNFLSVEIFIVAKDITAGPPYYICASVRRVARVQLLKLCHTSDYWDHSMSVQWTQKRKLKPMNSLSLV